MPRQVGPSARCRDRPARLRGADPLGGANRHWAGAHHPYGLRSLREQFPDVPMVVDAGLGLPSQAAAIEIGFDACS